MTQHDISVVICAYTEARWNDLLSAVASAQAQTCSPREIIVVVDYNLALLNRVREYFPQLVVIENTEPQGLSGARNSGIAAARGKWIAFLDDDAVATPDWLAKLSEHFDDSQIVGVGGQTEPLWLAAPPNWFPEEFYWVIGCSYRGLPDIAAPVRNPFGGNMCVRRSLFDAIGGFKTGIGRDRQLLRGCEETEFCIRARRHLPRAQFLYEPLARILHRVPQPRTRPGYFFVRCYSEGLSKAIVTRLHGAQDSLAAERSYALRVLPRAVARDLVRAIARRDFGGIAKTSMIVAGLGITVAGFIIGAFSRSGALSSNQDRAALNVNSNALTVSPE